MVIFSAAAFVSVLNTSMMNVGVPAIIDEFSISNSAAGWVITGYAIVFAIGTAVCGKALDVFPIHRLFAFAISVFLAGSLLCYWSPSFFVLVAGRAVQAAGAAAIPSLAFGAISTLMPAANRGLMFGIISSSVGLGAACGPVIGGMVISISSWHVLFLATTILLVILLPCAKLLPVQQPTQSDNRWQQLNPAGAVLFGVSIALVMVLLTLLQSQTPPFVMVFLIGATVAISWFTFRQSNQAEFPFIEPSVFQNPQFIQASSVAFIAQLVYLGGVLFVLPIVLSDQYHLNESTIGLVLAPAAITVAIASPISGRLADKFSPYFLAATGTCLLYCGTFIMALFALAHGTVIIGVAMVVVALGFAFIASAAPLIASSTLPEHHQGAGMGLFQMLFFLGAATGACVFGVLLQWLKQQQFTLQIGTGELSANSAVFLIASLVALIAVAVSVVALLNKPAK